MSTLTQSPLPALSIHIIHHNLYFFLPSDQYITQGNGYLNFDEFLALIKQTSIGIENNDLRRILQEADEDGNGVIEYEEFYPLILDLTLAFRTVNAAKVIVQKKDVLVEEETNRRILDINFEEAGEQLSMKVASYDPKKTGVVRHTDLKRALMAMAGPLELTMVEISLILRNLPANSFARINYATIPEALKQAKWTVCKRKIQEYLGGDVFSFLLKQFREKDSKINAESEYNQGLIGADDVLQVLKSHEMFQLNSIQIIILMSDIRKIHGQIDYWDHLSILAKSTQLMLDPSMLRQRAELLRPDLGSMSASALLHDESTDHINKSKLIAFFELNDKDGDRKINLKEFSDILGALELILNQQEVNALFSQIDSKDDGDITFQQFATFFETNLAHLERIKHMKSMYSQLHDKRNITDSVGGEAQQAHQIKELESHLLFIFNNAIEERGKASKVDDYYSENVHKDKLTKHEIHDILKTIDVSLTEFHLNTILGEMFADKDGYVELTEATTVSAHLLQTFLADLNDNMTPEQCSAVATEVIKSCAYEIHKITDFFMRGLSEIIHPVLLNSKDSNKAISGKKTEKQTKEGKEQEIINLIFSPHSGLTANEGNNLLHTFFDSKQRIQRKADGLFDETILHSTHLDAMEEDLQRKAAHSIRRKTSIFQNSKLTKFMRDDPNVDPTDLDKALGQKVERFVVPEPTGHLDLRMPKNQEMMNAITRVKKESVMRSLLQPFDAKEIEYGLLKCFRKALEIQVIQKKMTKNSVYLPVRAIFEILEEYTVLRLNRPQLLALVAFCPYYNRTDTELDFAKFAKYVGETVKELHDADHIHLRAKVVEMLSQEDVALGGQTIAYSKTNITEEEMDAYLIEEFLKAEDNKGEVTLPEFLRIVSNIPKCPLSKRDAIAIAAAFPHTSEGVQWQRFVPWAYLTLSMLDIEHKIRRRLPMLKFEQAAKEGDIHGKRVEVSGANEFASTSRPGTGVSRGQQPNPMDELTTLSKEACELLKVRAHTIENEDGTETERVLLLFPFDEDSTEVIDKGDTNLDDQETVASLDSIGKDQGYGEANIKLFEGMVEIEAHLVEPQLSMSGKSGKSFKSPSSKKMQSSPLSSPTGSPGRLSMRKRIPQATTSNGDKIIDMVQVTMTVNAIEQSMGLDRELAVCVKGVFDYNTLKSDSGVTFTVDLEDNMGMPSMCLIDPDSAKDFAESLHEKLFIEFTKNGIDVPRLKAKPTITYF
jgi:Ca2+-binding EF-hand superfamily protein